MTDSISEIMGQAMDDCRNHSKAATKSASSMTRYFERRLEQAGLTIVSTKPSVDRLARIDDIIEAEHDFAMDRAAAVYDCVIAAEHKK